MWGYHVLSVGALPLLIIDIIDKRSDAEAQRRATTINELLHWAAHLPNRASKNNHYVEGVCSKRASPVIKQIARNAHSIAFLFLFFCLYYSCPFFTILYYLPLSLCFHYPSYFVLYHQRTRTTAMSITMSERPLGPHRSSHRRSNSNIEVGLRPPRYSSIEGAFPPAHSAQDLPEPVGLGTAAQNDRRPPRYSSVFDRERGERDRRQRVRRSGSYRLGSSAAGPQLHEYNIRTGNGAKAPAFATLRLYSRSSASPAANAAASSMRVPKFAGADLVQGSLDLTLDPPQNINAISLTVSIGRGLCVSFVGNADWNWIGVVAARPDRDERL